MFRLAFLSFLHGMYDLAVYLQMFISLSIFSRKSGKPTGFQEIFKLDRVTVNKLPIIRIETARVESGDTNEKMDDMNEEFTGKVIVRGPGTAQLKVGDGGPSTWNEICEDMDENEDSNSQLDHSHVKKGTLGF